MYLNLFLLWVTLRYLCCKVTWRRLSPVAELRLLLFQRHGVCCEIGHLVLELLPYVLMRSRLQGRDERLCLDVRSCLRSDTSLRRRRSDQSTGLTASVLVGLTLWLRCRYLRRGSGRGVTCVVLVTGMTCRICVP